MGTLYIDRKDVELRRDAGRILIYEAGTQTAGVPVAHLERVVLASRAVLDTAVLRELAGAGVGVVVLDRRRPERTAWVLGRAHNDAARRIGQYRRFLDGEWRDRWATGLVRHKVRGQRRFLARALGRRPDVRYPLTNALRVIDERLEALAPGAAPPARGRVRGIEGAAAAAYFGGLTSLFAPALAFRGRNRRPPRDPVNACLSLTYTMLYSEALFAAQAAGLDPLIGLYHEPAFGRASLATDLMEPLRPRVDEWVWQLFREERLRAGDFVTERGACLLAKGARETYFRLYEGFAHAPRRHLRRHAQRLARAFAEDGEGLIAPEDEEEP